MMLPILPEEFETEMRRALDTRRSILLLEDLAAQEVMAILEGYAAQIRELRGEEEACLGAARVIAEGRRDEIYGGGQMRAHWWGVHGWDDGGVFRVDPPPPVELG